MHSVHITSVHKTEEQCYFTASLKLLVGILMSLAVCSSLLISAGLIVCIVVVVFSVACTDCVLYQPSRAAAVNVDFIIKIVSNRSTISRTLRCVASLHLTEQLQRRPEDIEPA